MRGKGRGVREGEGQKFCFEVARFRGIQGSRYPK